jgi:hydroxysqualene synthase
MTGPTMSKPATPPAISHYENFPVASWLCPPHLRAPIAAIYHFARTADDLADEGDAPAAQRLQDLQAYGADLAACAQGIPHSGRWNAVFDPLGPLIHRFTLPVPLLADLLEAFRQDVQYTASARRYDNDHELLDYCRRSANPVGRLLLHLYDVRDNRSLAQSDQICTALQLINFWQDLSQDLPRQRWYPSRAAMQHHGVSEAALLTDRPSVAAADLIANYTRAARAMMLSGAGLCQQVPGRAGWELRLVVQGGLRILDKIELIHCESWRRRVKLAWYDLPVLLWRASRMS